MAINPDYLAAFEHHKAGRLEAAEEYCRRVLAANPNYADAIHLLGIIAFQNGHQDDAAKLIGRAIEVDGLRSTFHSNLGNILKQQGKLHEALRSYHRALQLAPDNPLIHMDLGNVLQLQGKLDEALFYYQKAIELNPAEPVAHFNLGNVFKEQRRLQQASESYRRAINLKSDYAEANNNLGNVLQDQGKHDQAIACYRRALELVPDDSMILANLGTALRLQGKMGEAEVRCRRAVELKPDSAQNYNSLGGILLNQGKVDDAIACYRKAIELKPNWASVHDNLLIALQYRDGITLAELAAAHAEFERLHAAPLRAEWRQHEIDRNADRPLIVGFVSSNFRQHAVGHFVVQALENIDREHFKVVCYSDQTGSDDWTNRFRAASAIWRETAALRDTELAEQIRADRVDILFDLAGHTAMNRLLVFARKPAPIQVTWADYVGTTGLAAMDYILADRYEIPPEAEPYYTERVLRMPHGYVCYDPPPYAPPVSRLPAVQQGFVTFACFNFRPKITVKMLDVWANILQRLPDSRLLFKYLGMNDASVADNLLNEFSRRGIDPQRIECRGWSRHRELLVEYQRVDLALDTFPYNGGLTTCEAMWMGVPVITCPGETFASRHSMSHLSNVGLTETIARDLDDYVEVAMSLATDLSRLATIRRGLRDRLARSPLCDGRKFAHDMMRILREL